MSHSHEHSSRRKRAGHVVLATAYCAVMVALFAVGAAPLIGIAHAPGYFGGLALWFAHPMRATWARIKAPYLVALGAIAVHRIDEEVSAFVPAIEELNGRQAAAATSPISILIVVLTLAWILSPLLLRTGHPLGHFGAWSLFAAFGLVEPWHFVFPLFTPEPYGYFPGMVTAPIIIAAAWWGMWRMWQASRVARQEVVPGGR
jgi:hypothetical protein